MAEISVGFLAEILAKIPPNCFKHFFRFLARALAPRQKSEKMGARSALRAPGLAQSDLGVSAAFPQIPPAGKILVGDSRRKIYKF